MARVCPPSLHLLLKLFFMEVLGSRSTADRVSTIDMGLHMEHPARILQYLAYHFWLMHS